VRLTSHRENYHCYETQKKPRRPGLLQSCRSNDDDDDDDDINAAFISSLLALLTSSRVMMHEHFWNLSAGTPKPLSNLVQFRLDLFLICISHRD
jgi:hypothetical protein